MTVDTAHPLLTGDLTRDALYVAATRAAKTTTLYAVTHTELPPTPTTASTNPSGTPTPPPPARSPNRSSPKNPTTALPPTSASTRVNSRSL